MARILTAKARREHKGNIHPTYWRIRKCRFLGYLCSNAAEDGTWYAGVTLPNGHRRSKAIGRADDTHAADGIDHLDFYQALQRAEVWFGYQEDAVPDVLGVHSVTPFPQVPAAPPYTVGNAVNDYLRWYREHRKAYESQYYDFRNHVIDQLGHIPLSELTPQMIETWREELAHSAPIIPTGPSGPRRYGPRLDEPEWLKRRRSTSNNTLSKLKAALNRAFAFGYVDTDRAWSAVKLYRRVNVGIEPKHLTIEQVQRLIDVCPDMVANVVKGGICTGCRIGDLFKMRVEDYLPDLGRVKVTALKTNRFYHVTLSHEGVEFFDALVAGRRKDQHMFLNALGNPWTYPVFRKHFVTAQFDADFAPYFTFHRIRHTFAAHAVMAGIPLKVVASQLGHSSTLMVEQRYGHLRDDFISEKVREVMPRLYS